MGDIGDRKPERIIVIPKGPPKPFQPSEPSAPPTRQPHPAKTPERTPEKV